MQENFPANLQNVPRPTWQPVLLIFLLMGTAATTEKLMGRRWICPCGVIRLWAGDVNGPENSQQIADWYSFSHIIHGFLFYAACSAARRSVRRWESISIAFWLFFGVCIETFWEILENSPIIIARYRKTMSESYDGDSVLNSMSDISFAIIRFMIARRLPAWVTVLLAVGMELFVGYWIRDNLTLNIIMLIHPFAGIRRWQMGIDAIWLVMSHVGNRWNACIHLQ